MKKGGFGLLVGLGFLFGLPLASAQVGMLNAFLDNILRSDYFLFLALFGAFFSIGVATLSKFFDRGPATAISMFLGLLLAAGGVYSGFFRTDFMGWTAIALFILLVLEVMVLLFAWVKGKQGFQVNVLAINLFILGLIFVAAIVLQNVFIPFLPYIMIGGIIIALLSLGYYLITSRDEGRPGEFGGPWGEPWWKRFRWPRMPGLPGWGSKVWPWSWPRAWRDRRREKEEEELGGLQREIEKERLQKALEEARGRPESEARREVEKRAAEVSEEGERPEKPEPLPPVSPETERLRDELDRLRKAMRDSVGNLRKTLRKFNSNIVFYRADLLKKAARLRGLKVRTKPEEEEYKNIRRTVSSAPLRGVTRDISKVEGMLRRYNGILRRRDVQLFAVCNTLSSTISRLGIYIGRVERVLIIDTKIVKDAFGDVLNLCKSTINKIEEASRVSGIKKQLITVDRLGASQKGRGKKKSYWKFYRTVG